MSQFSGFGIEVELKDGKIITGRVAKANPKSLTLSDVTFSDGGTSQVFKVKASRLKDLKVVSTPKQGKQGVARNSSAGSVSGAAGAAAPAAARLASAGSNTDWQDDDAAAIKQQDDFDFQENLRMFNKEDVFAKLKEQDKVEQKSRLVSHNIKDRKFETDELVIPDAKQDNWDSLEEDSTHTEYLPITKSINITHLLQSAGDNEAKNDQVLSQLQRALTRPGSISKPSGFVTTTTGVSVPCATPVQLLEIERVCSDSFGFTSKMAMEHWAVHMSLFVKQKLGGRVRLHAQNTNPQPLVVILASDNRCGARALALGRVLCQSSLVRVLVLFTNTPEDPEVNEQWQLYQKSGGKTVESLQSLKSNLEKLNSPVEIVLDAMQGFDLNLQDLCSDAADEARLEDIINWCNAQQAVWSLDIPSGLDAGSALPNFSAHVNANSVICLCWPLTGAYNLRSQFPNHAPEIHLVDLGVPQAVYSVRSSLRKFQIADLFVTEGMVQLT
ncbi:Edc3p [Lachancea thermotolerans CBS 6340]|uniref:Enhancer of mRNA-decapping protein 3 n=1 Tax=Lachancea thermotolerans (strain ATCC 56472 / CBS 6340 / NRRL Y-8284) TaxID=559295 RepID=C5E3I9_LACTC|nr:KLTH0H13948p [Lachancea thermotolerans CBS 6340]CAR30600.1 KLTH0H13948p [Lachancea thermotolerans CBS 6340]